MRDWIVDMQLRLLNSAVNSENLPQLITSLERNVKNYILPTYRFGFVQPELCSRALKANRRHAETRCPNEE